MPQKCLVDCARIPNLKAYIGLTATKNDQVEPPGSTSFVPAIIDTGCSLDGKISQDLLEAMIGEPIDLSKLPRHEVWIATNQKSVMYLYPCNIWLDPSGEHAELNAALRVPLHDGLYVTPTVVENGQVVRRPP